MFLKILIDSFKKMLIDSFEDFLVDQDRQFQNPDRLQTVSEIFTCDRQFWTKQMWKIWAEVPRHFRF